MLAFAPLYDSGTLRMDIAMRILLTNDDGVFSPGLAALEQQLRHLGEVHVVAPATEQSGVSHSITYLTPLTCKSIHRDGRHWAWAVEGSPADCTKLAVTELMKETPVDLVVSGINGGLISPQRSQRATEQGNTAKECRNPGIQKHFGSHKKSNPFLPSCIP